MPILEPLVFDEFYAAVNSPALGAVLWLETALLAGLFITLLVGTPLRGSDTPAGLCASVCGLAAMGVQSAF